MGGATTHHSDFVRTDELGTVLSEHDSAHPHQSGVWEARAGGFGSWTHFHPCEKFLSQNPEDIHAALL